MGKSTRGVHVIARMWRGVVHRDDEYLLDRDHSVRHFTVAPPHA
jgi:hypothetical protein